MNAGALGFLLALIVALFAVAMGYVVASIFIGHEPRLRKRPAQKTDETP